MQHVRNNWQRNPELAAVGSYCLVGVVHNNILYLANSGDSRAVLVRLSEDSDFELVQLSVDSNAKFIERRDEVRAEHPNVPDLFKCDKGARLRGTLQVTRAIGDMYLKYNEFNRDPLPARFKQEHPIVRPVLKAQPTVQTYQLSPYDRFVIFASDGLWDEIDNEQAATLVNYNSRSAEPILEDKQRYKELVDPRLGGQYPEKNLNQAVRLARMCLQSVPKLRPKMTDLVEVLIPLATPDEETGTSEQVKLLLTDKHAAEEASTKKHDVKGKGFPSFE